MSTADVPGPPAIRNNGSGFLLRLMAGTRATNSSMLRPLGCSGFSGTLTLAHARLYVESGPELMLQSDREPDRARQHEWSDRR